jgi:hypothetical protein
MSENGNTASFPMRFRSSVSNILSVTRNNEKTIELQQEIQKILEVNAVDSYEAERLLADLGLRDVDLASAAMEVVFSLPTKTFTDVELLAAYIIAHTFQRRQGNPDKCELLDDKILLVDQGTASFQILRHFQVMTKMMLGKSEILEAIDLARTVANSHPDHPGVQHSLAASFVRLSDFRMLTEGELEEALLASRKAIAISPSKARFYYTKARIEKLFKKFEFALESLAKAIAKEDSTSIDYALRLAEYKIEIAAVSVERRIHDQQIETEKKVEQLSSDLTRARNSLEAAQARQVETLAVFTAILGLISGSLQVMFSFSLWQASVLLIVLGAVLIGSIYVAHLIIDQRMKKARD